VTVVAMKIPAGIEVSPVRAALRERYDIVIGGGQAELKGKIVRMGTMGDLTPKDVLGALDALGEVLKQYGFTGDTSAAHERAAEVLGLALEASAGAR
jgi:aspartate aminotransferase-like enzyme